MCVHLWLRISAFWPRKGVKSGFREIFEGRLYQILSKKILDPKIFLIPVGSEKSMWTDSVRFQLQISNFSVPKGSKKGKSKNIVLHAVRGSHKHHFFSN